jgi:penicillin-binding protein 2
VLTARSRLRLVVMQVVVISLLLTLLGRLWYLQVYEGAQYRQAADQNYIHHVVTEAVRGQILDDEGRPLVRNRVSLAITVDRSVLSQLSSKRRHAEVKALARRLGMRPLALEYRLELCGPGAHTRPPICWNGSQYQPIPVATDVSETVALSILERSEAFPGVAADLEAVRQYPEPYHANAAHELGYLGPVTDDEVNASESTAHPYYSSDLIGRSGLEAQYDSVLRGVNGVKQVAVDRAGDVIGTVGVTPPRPGDNLVTNLDARVQRVLEQQLAQAIHRARGQVDQKTGQHYKADSAAGVVLDTRNGHVIAMASLPTYDPAIWVGGVSYKQYAALTSPKAGLPLFSRAFQGGYAPGSTFKIVSSTAMLQNGYSEAGPYDCPSSLHIADRTFDNSESRGYGPISLTRAIEVSCDTVFYKVAYDQWLRDGGKDPIAHPHDIFIKAALAWKFGTATGLDLPGEASGNITTRQDRKRTWIENRAQYCRDAKTEKDPYLRAIARDNCGPAGALYLPGDAVNFIIGQGETLITPLKLAQAYAAIANGGTLWKPQVAKAVLSPTGRVLKVFRPIAQGHVPVDRSSLAFIRNALMHVPINGTAKYQFTDFPLGQIPIAAKTGTAEVTGKQTTSWFATYAPADKPRYAVVMMVSQGGFGSTTSADSVKAIYQALFGVKGKTVDPKLSILPGGDVPALHSLPVIAPDGAILPPGSHVPRTAAAAAVTPKPVVPILPSPSGGSTPAALPALGPFLTGDPRSAGGGRAGRSRGGGPA